MTTMLSRNDEFDGEFDYLPLQAQLEIGQIPSHPTSDDFQSAAMSADESPAHRWYCEAIRYRRIHTGAALDDVALKAIAKNVAEHLFRVVMEQ